MIIFNIKKIREEKEITLYRLEKLTGISRAYLYRLENNKTTNPTISTLYKIAGALDTNVKDLFYSKFDIENLREKMYCEIDNHGINSKEVAEISKLIDLLINIEMKEKKR
jgi:transcriptional regulator with XRE-family HTH domain